MRNRFALISAGMLLAAILAAGCVEKSNLTPVDPPADPAEARVEEVLAEAGRLESLAGEPDGGAATLVAECTKVANLASGSLVIVPPGSVDALASALATAGTGGVVLLKSGMHTESGTVTITTRLSVIGEPGAILKVDTTPYPSASFNQPALHVMGAQGVFVWGIDIRPVQPSGNTAILLEDAPNATIALTRISDHQVGILLHQSDRVFLFKNTIRVAADGYYGIEVINGRFASMVQNDISNAPAFGIFAADRFGTLLSNKLHANTIGVIFCKPPFGDAVLPSGEVIGADLPATDWVAKWNNATNNQWGYLAIDGATGCRLWSNQASSNAVYDVELAGDSFRFGFLTPTSSNCTVIITNPSIVVKDCGLNNTVIGGTQVDTTADPCY